MTFFLPAASIDSDEIFEVALSFFVGPNPIVLLQASDPLPRDLLKFIVDAVVSVITEADWDSRAHLDLARDVRNLGIWLLHSRTRSIEQSVRNALDDDELTSTEPGRV